MSKVSIKGKEKVLPAVIEPDTDMIGSVETVKEIPQPPSVPHGIGESSKSPQTAPKLLENAAPKAASKSTLQPKSATKAECPPKLQPIFDAKQRRATKTAANLAFCSAAISGVKATLLPLTNGSYRQFVDSMIVYLCAAIAKIWPRARPLRHPSSLLARRTQSQGLPMPGAQQYPPSQCCP
ncbi:EKA-like protein [Blumeria hordei DH14]|uniref:EKA-like protein n=1 Tax=Blumeria graminis f. sp. hordei (strain DH14) TaxID=546991 RepID=N1JLH7_BLUG1|nr:EKA-like protein [Blumeria hordei DH14]